MMNQMLPFQMQSQQYCIISKFQKCIDVLDCKKLLFDPLKTIRFLLLTH